MVQMMESQCEYFMYFPAVPITDLSDPARYRTLPRRSHLYLGETVRFLLVLRCRDGGATPTEHCTGEEGSREDGGGGPYDLFSYRDVLVVFTQQNTARLI